MERKKAKAISIALLSVFLALMIAMIITVNPVWGYVAIVVMGVYGIFHHLCWRCPKCGENLGPLWVKCCPHCGKALEESEPR